MYVWVENPVNYIASGQGNHQRGGIQVTKQDSVHTQSAKKPSLPRQTISAEILEVRFLLFTLFVSLQN